MRELRIEYPARVQISLGNRNCSGDALKNLCNWLAAEGITNVEFQLADTLHRHNLKWMHGISNAVAKERSKQLGDDWISKNSSLFEYCMCLFDRFEVSRWEHWIGMVEYSEAKEVIYEIYSSDTTFRDLLSEEIDKHFEKIRRTQKTNRVKNSLDYLIEEIAVSELACIVRPSNDVYPGPRFEPEEYLASKYRNANHIQLADGNFVNYLERLN